MKTWEQWLNQLTGRDPEPPERAMTNPNPPLEGAIYDLCLTTLLTPRTAPVWTRNNLVAAPWSRVLALPAFDLFRDRADRYYRSLDASGALVPTVTRFGGSIKVEFEQYGVVSIALFDAGQTRMGHGIKGEPIVFRAVTA